MVSFDACVPFLSLPIGGIILQSDASFGFLLISLITHPSRTLETHRGSFLLMDTSRFPVHYVSFQNYVFLPLGAYS